MVFGLCMSCLYMVLIIPVVGTAKLMVSLLQEMQANDHRVTMLQLVDKLKVKHKTTGLFATFLLKFYTNALSYTFSFRHIYLIFCGLCKDKI